MGKTRQSDFPEYTPLTLLKQLWLKLVQSCTAYSHLFLVEKTTDSTDNFTTTGIINTKKEPPNHSAGLSAVFIIIGLLLFTLLVLMFKFALPSSSRGRRWCWGDGFERKLQIARPTMWSTHPMRDEISSVTVYEDNVRKVVLYGDDDASMDDHGAVVRQQKETGRNAVTAPGSRKFTTSNRP